MRVFVTVGTTRFDDLVEAVLDPSFLQLLVKHGFNQLILQHGHSPIPPQLQTASIINRQDNIIEWTDTVSGMTIQAYSFKPSLLSDMQSASRIISHAGSGCILEALYLHKQLFVVVNSSLMHNHQQDLAHILQQQGHLYFSNSVSDLAQVFAAADFSVLKPFSKPDRTAFMNILHDMAGFPAPCSSVPHNGL
ncbi:hypothetical protein BATDEDRAFT_10179 [Batrachochytrium dendrobatidis JAM81]|uniref:UDP-N-acetylglucosamine transferase subunit ALG13 n=2 Tax=Batrachochytrium dendrobatidis TaxID=109871 RepID=F4NY67_BATDJ|nr:N-acetylglucosaminyldiphosphodolichol N-acetylglucosaminyltransferase catalytic subunit ALG13 [Batrachochytrium dendrobatidis JAM81]EGF82268.1 hypothetical protein BATDEDRAFT_10179 [Batrachochytrium dendrobatidis JAM81]KAJ8324353.1 N-acetylglucosaminyldiphosphodolichol N-acetylglucosaminyltransferase catalytic subunit alg13 [Batrachochytrium dendrobatidis]KAK5670605.1 N-acetylglucosaminyldiphosphodolichol N-acetylglucosaminyltransferase catalytic subunit alg13 [Batrachochytrium dendrobatidis]|eukprot:XP_006677154.1 hypothetical protein BATDEDRAFT_10179 [Batrachochytrium dendrobatidis JAM81]